jgi:hypothetical protein
MEPPDVISALHRRGNMVEVIAAEFSGFHHSDNPGIEANAMLEAARGDDAKERRGNVSTTIWSRRQDEKLSKQ